MFLFIIQQLKELAIAISFIGFVVFIFCTIQIYLLTDTEWRILKKSLTTKKEWEKFWNDKHNR